MTRRLRPADRRRSALWLARVALCGSLAGLAVAPPARGQAIGPVFHVNTFTPGAQYDASLAAAAAGSFVVVWRSEGQDGDGYGIFGQRFDSAGLPAGGEFQVHTATAGNQWEPSVAMDGAGNFVVVWESWPPLVVTPQLLGRRFDAAGAPLGGEFEVGILSPFNYPRPAVAARETGEFVVVWSGEDPDAGYGIFGQRFDATGVQVGEEFLVAATTGNSPGYPDVGVDADGGFVVVWENFEPVPAGREVRARRYGADGAPAGGAFQVNSYTTGDQGYPKVAVGAAAQFLVVWRSELQDGSDEGVFGQRFDAAGDPEGDEFRVNVFTEGSQWFPSVAVDGSGEFVVSWMSLDQDGSDFGVYRRHFDAQGRPLSGDLQVNTWTFGFQGIPRIRARGEGEYVAAWVGQGQEDDPEYGVFGLRLRAPLLLDDFETGDTCAWTATTGGGNCF